MTKTDNIVNAILTERLEYWDFPYFFTLTIAGDDSPLDLQILVRQFIGKLTDLQGSEPDFWYSVSSTKLGDERYHIHGFLGGVKGLDERNIEAAWHQTLKSRNRRGTIVLQETTGEAAVYGYATRQARWSHSNVPELKTRNIINDLIEEGRLDG